MKRTIIYLGFAFATAFALSGVNASRAQAQMMGGWSYSGASSTPMTASDTQAIAAGQTLYQQLQSGALQCSALTQDQYDQLGEYFMQQVTGAGHPAMDAMISSMMGEQGDTAMHVAWGERYSGCDADAALPMNSPGGWSTPGNNDYYGTMPMMGYGYNGGYGYGPYGMMGYGYGGGPVGWIIMILFWALLIVGIVALVRWFVRGGHRGWHGRGHSAIDILKERYAKGEIDRKEFEEKKKDLES